MSTKPLILITRPEKEAQKLAAALAERNIPSFIEPLLSIKFLDFELPQLEALQGLIFTSANGVEALAQATDESGLAQIDKSEMPVFLVGSATQDAAHSAGFKNTQASDGGGEALAALIKRFCKPENGPFLHIRGEDIAYDVGADLKDAGFEVESVIAYRAVQASSLSTDAQDFLKDGRVDAITFFSKRTAECFMELCSQAGLSAALGDIKALCISESVVKCVRSSFGPNFGRGTYAAEKPDQAGMLALIQQHYNQQPANKTDNMTLEREHMSQTQKKTKGEPIENAREVIERFGGIRPMAKKIDVAVTTVQGWKKRDVIPATRRTVIMEAAEEYNVDLTDIIADAPPANENTPAAERAEEVQNDRAETSVSSASDASSASEDASGYVETNVPTSEGSQKKSGGGGIGDVVVTRTVLIGFGLVVLALIAVAALLWPRANTDQAEQDRLAALEARTQEIASDVEDVKDQQSFFGTLIPENLDEQLATLKDQAGETAGQVREQAGAALERAQVVSNDVLGDDAGTIVERMEKLETHLQDVTGSPVLAGLLEKINVMEAAPEGESRLDSAVAELSTIVGDLRNTGQLTGEGSAFEATLDAARTQNEALGETFENVPSTDLKAAAMLLTMTQFRSSLNRDNESFANDLGVLMGLVSEDNVELRTSLERLAPHAEQGVLTPSGLSNEFKTIAGDAVVASLQGEDVSVSERAKARMNELFQVEKDGELITGTETQAVVAKADQHLQDGEIEAAIATVQTLDGPAAAQMAGWLDKANATVLAERLKGMLGQSINMQAYGAAAGFNAGNLLPQGLPGSSTLIQNEETGINILRRNQMPAMPGTPSNANPYR
ncbi:MAG: uroporphyrinogen-III synthase [Pseudomonadota bacterium]